MKKVITFLFLIFIFSCDEQIPTTCGVEDPLQQLYFLQEAKNTIDVVQCAGKSQIIQYTYKNEIVFLVNICNSIVDGQTQVYNCQGEVICKFGGIAGENTCADFDTEAKNKILLYGDE